MRHAHAIRFVVLILALVGSALSPAAAQPAPPPPPGVPPLALPGASDPAAWAPREGSPPAESLSVDGRPLLRFRCAFSASNEARAAWDLPLDLDLTDARGVELKLYCADPSAISGFTLYLRANGVWQSASLLAAPHEEDPSGWITIGASKGQFAPEGKPAGWGRVDMLRLAAWRGDDVDASFCVADLTRLAGHPRLALLLAEEAINRGDDAGKSIATYTRHVDRAYAAVGLAPKVLSDIDLNAASLAGVETLVIPYAPRLNARAASVANAFVDGGGGLVVFYEAPADLLRRAGIRLGDIVRPSKSGGFSEIRPAAASPALWPPSVPQNSWNIRRAAPVADGRTVAVWHDADGAPTGEPAVVVAPRAAFMSHVLLGSAGDTHARLALAMAAHVDPELARDAALVKLRRAGRIGGCADFDACIQTLREGQSGQNAEQEGAAQPDPLLDAAEQAYRNAENLIAQGEYAAAIDAATDARGRLLDAYCAAQTPRPGEFRAFWCHDARGVPPHAWDEVIAELKRAGYTAILPNMLWGGVAFYPSRVLPVAASVQGGNDPMEACVAACQRHGIACHVWKVCFNMAHNAPASFRDRMRREGRTQVRYDGSPEPAWLCPTHPDNQRLEVDALAELAAEYPIDGVHLDYIRYESSDTCYCAGCRKRFEARIGRSVPAWPASLRSDPALRDAWLDFRRAAITKVVADLRRRLDALRPGIALSAAVFPSWPSDRDRIGQDWGQWCQDGLLDFACPMNYTPNPAHWARLVERQLGWVGDAKLYPGIGVSAWPEAADIERMIAQIHAARRVGAPGFTVFQLQLTELRRILPRSAMGITRP